MKRRSLHVSLCVGALAPREILGRRPTLPVIGFFVSNAKPAELLPTTPPGPSMRSFLAGLREFGRGEGRNIVIERHTAEGRVEQAQAIFSGLAARCRNRCWCARTR